MLKIETFQWGKVELKDKKEDNDKLLRSALIFLATLKNDVAFSKVLNQNFEVVEFLNGPFI